MTDRRVPPISSRCAARWVRAAASTSRRPSFELLEDRRLLATNQPPVNAVPGPQETQVNTPLAFTDFRGNLIGVSDPDVGGNKLRVTLAATHGVITLIYPDPNGGLTYSEGDGAADVTMTFTGTVTDINAAFEWVVFTPESDYVGLDAGITITTNDQGFVGTGGPKEDSDFISIAVSNIPSFDPSPSFETLPAALDSTFDVDGRMVLSLSAGVDYISQLLPLGDGGILAVGAINDHFGLMRFDSNISLDPTFGMAGVVEVDFGAGVHALSVEMLPDGDLIVGGGGIVSKFSSGGVLDSTFGVNGAVAIPNGYPVYDIGIQADGWIVVPGPAARATRISSNGVVDQQLLPAGFGNFVETPRGIAVTEDGYILSIGDSGNSREFAAMQWNAAGIATSLQMTAFGIIHNTGSSLQLHDGKILQIGEVDGDVTIARRQANGILDASFGTGGATLLPILSSNDWASRATLQRDGRILIAGSAFNGVSWEAAVIRLEHDGLPDWSFVAGSSAAVAIDVGHGDDLANDVLQLPDGKILLAGRSGDDIALVRLLGDSDIISPTAELLSPSDGGFIDVAAINGQGYLEVAFSDEGGSGLDAASLTDVEGELQLSGTAAASVVLEGAPMHVSGSTYRYYFTGAFTQGPVGVDVLAETFQDSLANANDPSMFAFTVTPPPTGDFDQSGAVNGGDFLLWQRGFGKPSPSAMLNDGDGDWDGDVDSDDLAVWREQFGQINSTSILSATAPATPALVDNDSLANPLDGNALVLRMPQTELAGLALWQVSNKTATSKPADLILPMDGAFEALGNEERFRANASFRELVLPDALTSRNPSDRTPVSLSADDWSGTVLKRIAAMDAEGCWSELMRLEQDDRCDSESPLGIVAKAVLMSNSVATPGA